MNEKSAEENQNPDDFIKNPTVLEFLKLPTSKAYTEREFEQTLIDNLQQFLLELGKGFSFVARQKHIRTETQDFFIDLVFYNYILKCFVIIELKTTKLTHQDIGQLDMYVRMFDDLETTEGDNPTVGILLCTETDSTIAKYSVLKENKQLFANKYLPYLPSEAELVAEIEREKIIIKQQLGL
jgi:RecB family endonuclease NucS